MFSFTDPTPNMNHVIPFKSPELTQHGIERPLPLHPLPRLAIGCVCSFDVN